MKSSPKVILYPKEVKSSVPYLPSGSDTPTRIVSVSYNASSPSVGNESSKPNAVTWVCPICSFSNPVPSNFDPVTANSNTPLPPCLACGIKPSFSHILKAAIKAAAGTKPTSDDLRSGSASYDALAGSQSNGPATYHADERGESRLVKASGDHTQTIEVQCPRCTFLNHASLPSCELCGAPLPARSKIDLNGTSSAASQASGAAPSEPGLPQTKGNLSIKFSFHKGGGSVFHDRLKDALTQRKWLLTTAPPIPTPVNGTTNRGAISYPRGQVQDRQSSYSPGIAGLERRGLELRQKNEAVIGSAFSDLDALRASAKEIIALAESFAGQAGTNPTGNAADVSQLLFESAKALDMVTTKDIAGIGGRSRGNDALFLSEVARNLAEYLTDDSKGVLKREGGIMSLVDLWALYNRARSEAGVDLIAPQEFEQAAQQWEKLHLVVQQADRTDDKTIAQLLNWLQALHSSASLVGVQRQDGGMWDTTKFGQGVTAQETAQHFGWSVGVATEELEMAEERGALCRDEAGSAGMVTFWENWILDLKEVSDFDDDTVRGQVASEGSNGEDGEIVKQRLREMGFW